MIIEFVLQIFIEISLYIKINIIEMFSQRYINIKSKFIDLTYSFVSEELYHSKKISNLHSKTCGLI